MRLARLGGKLPDPMQWRNSPHRLLRGSTSARLILTVWLIVAWRVPTVAASAPGPASLAVDFSCLEDVVKPVGPVAANGADTVALLAVRAWAKQSWVGIRPLSIDPRQQELRYLLREEEASLLREFTETYPDSMWTPPILSKLGKYYRRNGRYSVALQLWEEAWRLSREASDDATRELADDTLGELVTLLAQLGHAEKLAVVLAEGANRGLRLQPHGERYRNAMGTLAAMNAAPEWCYRCGSLAVGLVGNALTGTRDYTRAIAKLRAPPAGFSLYQLQELAGGLGLDMVAAHWGNQPDIVVPSVVHWQDQHYAAIVEGHGNWYVVKDPTMREPLRLHRSAILQEASGFFLVPRNRVPATWTVLSAQEAATVVGRGYDDSLADDQDEPGCPYGTAPLSYGGGGGGAEPGAGGCGGGGCWSKGQPGVMEWFVSEPFINLWLRDTPLRYQPAYGEREFGVDLLYRQRGIKLFDRWYCKQFTEVGSGFVLPWQAAISVGVRDEQGNQDMIAYTPTGSVLAGAFVGGTIFTGRIFLNNSMMERVIDPGSGELSELRLWYGDGACDIYATVITNSYGELNRLALTRRLDRFGHGVTIQYASDPEYPEYAVIHRVLDADNHALTFYYSAEEGLTNRLSRMVDWTGRTVTLAHDEDHPHMLVQITDPVGMRSQISYVDGTGTPSALVTPYGRTEFEHASLRNEHQEYRCITVTRPTGAQERFYYEMDYDGVWMNPIDPRNQGYTVPSGTPYNQLTADFSDRNSYYWDARNFANLSTTFKNDPGSGLFSADDAMRARGRHWLRDGLDQGGTLVYPVLHAERAASPDTAAQTRGQITWYDYPGKPIDDNLNIGAFIYPAVIARIMSDATTAWTWNEPNDLGHVQQRIEKWVAGGLDQYRTNTFEYASNGIDLIEQRFGPPGGDRPVVGYGYDPAHPHQPVVMANSVGEVTAYSYDGLHRLSTTLSPSGLLTTRQYGGDGYVLTVIESIGGVPQRTNSYAYTENRLSGHTDARFLTTYYTFDDLGRLLEIQSGDAHQSWSFGLASPFPNSTGDQQILEPTAYHDRLGTNWTYTAWTADRRKDSVTDPRGTVIRYTYCDCGAVESVTEGYGLGIAETTSCLYDQQGRLTQSIAPEGTTLTYGYDLPGRRTTVTDAFGTTTYGYDNLDRLVSAANAAGQVQVLVYDIEDHPVSVTDASGVTVVSTYDDAGRLRTRSYPDGGVEAWGYSLNVAGTTSYTNQVGNVTLYAYDAAGLRTNETQVGVFTNSFVYWPGGELRYLYDGKGNRTEWRYDLYGRVSEKQYQGQSTPDLLYSYDAAGRLTNRFTRTGIGANTNGYSTAYTYDGVGNLIVVSYPAGTASITNTFDPLNRLATILDGLGTTVYGYVVLGNGLRTSSENPPWSATDTVTVTNRFGRRGGLSIQQPSGQFVVTNSYDAAGRWAVAGGTAGAFTYNYPPNASVQPIGITLPGGGYVTNWYDAVARLTRTELRTSGGTILNAHGYQYNAANQRTLLGRTNSAVSAWNGYVTAAYDAAGQLAQAWTYQPNGTPVTTEKWSYGYDAAQNLSKRTNNTTVETFTVNALNQLQSIPNSTPTYDRRGNLVSRYFPGGPQYYWYYTYDHENQLTSVATDTMSTPTGSRWKVEFTYDGQGRLRVKKDYVWYDAPESGEQAEGIDPESMLLPGQWQLSSEIRYLYDEMLLVQERNGSNTPMVTYTRGRDLSGSLAGAGGIGGLLARSHGYSAGNWSYHNAYQADGNGTVTALVNSAGTLQASYKYDPYGRYLAGSGGLAGANVMRFSSKPWVGFSGSTTSGLYYYGCRFYDPHLQRWPDRDPLGEEEGINLYGYVRNNPNYYMDTDGRLVKTLPTLGVGIGGGGAAVGTGGAVVVGGVVVAGAAAAGLVGYDLYLMNQIHDLNQQNAQAQTAIQIAEQQLRERKAYHKRCDEPPPPNLTGCDLLHWLLQRAKDCVGLRQGYVDKWNDTYKGHRDQIEQRQREIERLEERIKKECQPCPPK